ncbi:MAG: 2OG-Fe(II) oxygenase [Pirellulales bacterium]
MNAKKQRDKNRRRAAKLAEQAWEAANDGNLDLAVKVIQRAVDAHPANPLLWHDRGELLRQSGQDQQAAACFQTAIQLAPDFADAYASLAAIYIRQGQAEPAVALQREAVRYAPHTERYQANLAAYEALAVGQSLADRSHESKPESSLTAGDNQETWKRQFPELVARIENLEWPEIEGQLTRHGWAQVPALLSPADCQALRAMYDDGRLFSKSVSMNKNRFGKGVYRYFASPIPDLVDALRRLVYPHVAQIANDWQRLLQLDDLFPATWSGFRQCCSKAGQNTPSPLLLRYEAGGFNAPHQDIRGEVFFPLQLVIVLSPRAESSAANHEGFTGGEFLFCDQPERKPSDRCAIPAGLGDVILFCTRSRLVRVGGVYGFQPVKHGLDRITSGRRYALGIPFHEFE